MLPRSRDAGPPADLLDLVSDTDQALAYQLLTTCYDGAICRALADAHDGWLDLAEPLRWELRQGGLDHAQEGCLFCALELLLLPGNPLQAEPCQVEQLDFLLGDLLEDKRRELLALDQG